MRAASRSARRSSAPLAFVLLAAWLVPWHPVPGGMPDPVAADTVFSAEQIQRAEDYARWARVWSWSSLALSLAVACWLGFGKAGSATGRPDVRPPWWVQVIVVIAALTVIGRLVTLPFAIAYRRLQLDAGLSTSSWPAWTVDLVKGELVDIVATSIALVALVGIARRWRRAWPIVAGGVLAAFVVVASFGYPLLVEPLFNSFTPLEDGPLRTQILELADEEGVEIDDVLVADASRRTTTLNAYVSGFGSTRRVVVYDTLVDDLSEDQALSVVAHELAHARNDDVLIGTSLGAAGALVGVGLLGLLAGVAERRGRPRVGEVGAVPMILALAAHRNGAGAARSRTASAGRSRPVPMSTLWRRRMPPSLSSPCSVALPSSPSPTRRRPRGRSGGSAPIRRSSSGSPSPAGAMRGHQP